MPRLDAIVAACFAMLEQGNLCSIPRNLLQVAGGKLSLAVSCHLAPSAINDDVCGAKSTLKVFDSVVCQRKSHGYKNKKQEQMILNAHHKMFCHEINEIDEYNGCAIISKNKYE